MPRGSHTNPNNGNPSLGMAQEYARYQAIIDQKDQTIRYLCHEISGHMAQNANLRIQREDLYERLRAPGTQVMKGQQDLGQSLANNQKLQDEVIELKQKLNELQGEHDELKGDALDQEAYLDVLREEYNKLQESHHKMRSELHNKTTRLATVEKALWNHRHTVSAKRARMTEGEEEEEEEEVEEEPLSEEPLGETSAP